MKSELANEAEIKIYKLKLDKEHQNKTILIYDFVF